MSLQGLTDAEILDIVDPVMDKLMDASTHIDHAGIPGISPEG